MKTANPPKPRIGRPPLPPGRVRQRTQISLDPVLLARARALSIVVSRAAEEGIRQEIARLDPNGCA